MQTRKKKRTGEMTRICSACKVVLGTTDDNRDCMTHGFCEDCIERQYMQLFPVGARVTLGDKHGEIVKHLQTRVMVLWDDVYDDEAEVVAPSTLELEVTACA
jgi:hypothetical protein